MADEEVNEKATESTDVKGRHEVEGEQRDRPTKAARVIYYAALARNLTLSDRGYVSFFERSGNPPAS